MDFDLGGFSPVNSIRQPYRKSSDVKVCLDYGDDWFYADLIAFSASNGERETGILLVFESARSGSSREYSETGMEPERQRNLHGTES